MNGTARMTSDDRSALAERVDAEPAEAVACVREVGTAGLVELPELLGVLAEHLLEEPLGVLGTQRRRLRDPLELPVDAKRREARAL